MNHFETRAVHAGERKQAGDFSPISTPIYASTTFAHNTIEETDRVLGGDQPGYSYTRYGNPTIAAFEEAMESLEGSGDAFAFASGMAAVHAALLSAEAGSGSTVLAAEQLFGTTSSLLMKILAPLGIETRFVDIYNVEEVERRVEELSPAVLILESISNPLLRVADISSLSKITRAANVALIVDNTFATPYLQRSLELGADVVVYSATKYLSGHGDLTGGVVLAGGPYNTALDQISKLTGGILGPFEAWLALRGLKTLPLRMQRQCQNAEEIARWLTGHPKISKVHYPGLTDHPDHKVVARMLTSPGAMVAFELTGGDRETAFRFLNSLQLCVRAPSLGDVYTLAIHPATSSHRELSPSRRERLGIGEGLIRLSVGIEHPEDLIADLEQALHKV